MNEENASAEAGSTQEPPSLNDQLSELEREQNEAHKKQIDTNIKDLSKLIDEASIAGEKYEESYEQLKNVESQLIRERDSLSKALSAALESTGIDSVKSIVSNYKNEVAAAKNALDLAEAGLNSAQQAADVAAQKRKQASDDLDLWRNPVDTITKRLGAAQKLVTEIQKLRNSSRRGEAYWKLALGDQANGVPDQLFLNNVLDDEPQLIYPSSLEAKITSAWSNFTAARTQAASKELELEQAKSDYKNAVFKYKSLEKNLIIHITDALAEREASEHAA